MNPAASRGFLATLVLALAVFASGCAEFNVRAGYQLAPSSGKGVLAMGITADDTFKDNFYWHLRRVGAHESRDITFYTIYDPLIWEHPRGRLVFIELADGDYEFFDWGGVFRYQPTPEAYFRIPFSIRSGRVTYLGHLDLTKDDRAGTYRVASTNRYADDRPLLASKIGNLSDAVVDQDQAVMQPCLEADCRKPKPMAGGSLPIVVVIRTHR